MPVNVWEENGGYYIHCFGLSKLKPCFLFYSQRNYFIHWEKNILKADDIAHLAVGFSFRNLELFF